MSRPVRGFIYPLEPMRMKRQWERDVLTQQLAAIEGGLAGQRAGLAPFEDAFSRARSEWLAGAGGGALDVQLQRVRSAYLADVGAAVAARREEIETTLLRRQDVQERLAGVQRLLEGIEQHRGRLQAEHRRAGLARQYRATDDAWVERLALSEERAQ